MFAELGREPIHEVIIALLSPSEYASCTVASLSGSPVGTISLPRSRIAFVNFEQAGPSEARKLPSWREAS